MDTARVTFNMKILILFHFLIFASISPSFGDSQSTYRLPDNHITLYSYDLRIVPYLEKDFNFDGDMKIQFYATATFDCLTLNSKDLKIKEITASTSRITYTVTREEMPDKEMLKICFSPRLSFYAFVTVRILYSGKMNDEFKGLYKIAYEQNGVKKWMAATQFEPTYARMAFPCFDEPAYKAKFALTVARYSHQIASSISQRRLTSAPDAKLNNRVLDSFQETEPLPVYLISFAVHEFSSKTLNSDAIMYSREHAVDDTIFFLNKFNPLCKELETYLSMPYSNLQKELMATPDADEYSRTAGLTIYSEIDVFQKNGIDMEKHKEQISKTIVHKMTHFWLGGYVVPNWWDDAWLTESFATLFEYTITSRVEPTWQMENLFDTEVRQTALFEDINSNMALAAPMGHPNDIQSHKFNSVINEKGASILKMLENVVEKNKFQKALQITLKESNKRTGVIQPNELWSNIQNEVSNNILPPGETISSIMSTWMNNRGYPLLTITRTAEGNLVTEQEIYRFPFSLEVIPAQTWKIPITCTKQSSAVPNVKPVWSLGKEKVTIMTGLNDKEWAFCNVLSGYYRVNYDNADWTRITTQLKNEHTKIDTKHRAQLIDDSFHLAISNKLSCFTALQLGTYLEKEEEVLPWLAVMKYITYLSQLYQETSASDYIRTYFVRLLKRQYDRTLFNAKSSDDYLLKTRRSTVLTIACALGVDGCRYEASQIYNRNINDLTKVPAELKYVVYCVSFRMFPDVETAWNKLWMVYKNSKSMSEKVLILQTLACADDEILYKKYLRMIIQPSDWPLYKYEKQEIIKSTAQSSNGVTAALEVIAEIIPQFSTQSEETIQTLISIANQTSSNIRSENHISKLTQIINQVEASNKKNEAFLKTLKTSRSIGLKKQEYISKNTEEMKQAVHSITGYTPPVPETKPAPPPPPPQNPAIVKPEKKTPDTTTTPPKPSSGNFIIPQPALYVSLLFSLIINHFLM